MQVSEKDQVRTDPLLEAAQVRPGSPPVASTRYCHCETCRQMIMAYSQAVGRLANRLQPFSSLSGSHWEEFADASGEILDSQADVNQARMSLEAHWEYHGS